ncbi:ATP-binding protein [Marinobacterium sp. YM272]|uniref:ATP-binding protein n=1 Tax=Marinobacterium sp. YM272 TaxID=3421654 RepID=UPI003D7F9C99
MGSAPLSVCEKERLKALNSYRILETDTEFCELTRLAAYLCGTPVALISFIDTDRLWFKSRVGLEILQTPRSNSFCTQTILQSDVLEIEDASNDSRCADNPLVRHRPHIRFYAGAPLITPEGLVIGTLCVMSPTPMKTTAKQRKALQTLAQQVMARLELRKKTEELSRSVLKSEQENSRKARFLANMSHEIGTPIDGLMGALQQLESELTSPEAQQNVRHALLSARHLTQIVDDILDYSRIESNDLQLDMAPMELDNLLRKLAALLSSQVGDKPLDIWFDIDPDVPQQLIADEFRLSQVLLNLGENAVKFTEHGRVVIKIHCEKKSKGQVSLYFEVMDTGIGISPDQQHRVFEAFRQADASISKRFGGSGLGLAISRELVEMMGGKLAFKSEYGLGARFYFTLQLKRPTPDAVTDQTAEETRSPEVLLLSKSEVSRRILANFCHTLGWSTSQAGSGRAALSLYQEREESDTAPEIDLVLIDSPTLVKSDHCLLEYFDSLPKTQRPVCVYLSRKYRSLSSLSLEENSKEIQLIKPLVPSILQDRVAQALTPPEPDAEEVPTLTEQVAAEDPLAGVRLLLVEDNRVNATVATLLLETQGAQVIWKRNGEEAYRFFTDDPEPVDIILMDLDMPVMDGFSATENIRRERQWDRIPIVALTINGDEALRNRCLTTGMQDCLDKPFDSARLTHTILGQLKGSSEGPGHSAAPI